MILLNPTDPLPVGIDRPAGRSPFLLVGDHAGRAIPERLHHLGLAEPDLSRHIAWDIGIRRLGGLLAERMDAPFIHQAYSRLVADCNRGPEAPALTTPLSDGSEVPGNQAISAAEKAARLAEIHTPYHEAIAGALAQRRAAGRRTIVVALHSFTPVMRGTARPWHAGILHNGANDSFALALRDRLRAAADLCIGDNQPYQMDGIDYTIPHHCFADRLPYAEIEVRQNLLESDEGAEQWSAILADALTQTLISSP